MLLPSSSLLSAVLTLRPVGDHTQDPFVGRAWHATVLKALAAVEADLAESLHTAGPKPLTASGVLGRGEAPFLRVTALTRPVAVALTEAFTRPPLAPGSELRLAGTRWQVLGLATHPAEHVWAGQTHYDALALPRTQGWAETEPRLTLEFASPTTFKSNGLNMPVPMPHWVFGSLLDRWNAFAPRPMPEEARAFAALQMALSRYELRTVAIPFKEDMVKFGALGSATYTAHRPPQEMWQAAHVLADFALFAGVGAQTALGFGQCRRIEN